MTEFDFVVEDVIDPDEIRRSHTQDQRHRRNSDWLQAHGANVLPQARGRFVAVAGQEAFIAETPTEAWAWVDSFHPEDTGAIVRYIRASIGPRLYAHRRCVASRRRWDDTARRGLSSELDEIWNCVGKQTTQRWGEP